METMILPTLEHLSIIQAFLESLMLQLGLPPDGLVRISDQALLPLALQQIICRGAAKTTAWAAWSEYASEVDLYTAELSPDLSRRNGHPTLHLLKYDQTGKVREHAHWVRVADECWERNLH